MTLGEMLQQMSDATGGGTNAHLTRMHTAGLNRAYAFIWGMRNWRFALKQGTVALTATSTLLSLPSDCRAVAAVGLRSTGKMLKHRAVSTVEIRGSQSLVFQASWGRATPEWWDAFGGQLILMPLPGYADTADIWYWQSFTPLVATTDEPLFPADYHYILVDLARAEQASTDVFDRGAASRYDKLAERMIGAMILTCETSQPVSRHYPWLEGTH